MNLYSGLRLRDVSRLITKGTTPTTIGYSFAPMGVNYIKAESITRGGEIDPTTFAFISEKTHALLKRSKIEADDILITIAGIYLGKVTLIRKEHVPANTNQAVAIVRIDKNLAQPEYIRYFLFERNTTKYLNMLCPQSAQPNLNLTQLAGLKLNLPNLQTQRKIAAILTAYDDLIETNKRRIALLEKMAEEIYREWFVRMRFPGYQDTIFVKGMPVGWAIRDLRDCADINPSSLGKSERPDFIHYVDIGSVTTNRIEHMESMPLSEAPGRAKRCVQHGDIIWSSVRPANRAYCLMYKPIENTVVSTGFAVIRPKQETPFTFLNFVVTSNGFVDQMASVAKGAAYPATSFDDFGKAKLLWPGVVLLQQFHKVCEPLLGQKNTLDQQSQILTKNRDLLLPRMISGKLSVADLDIQFPPSMREWAHTHILRE